jgi:hypothetical protein
LAERRLYAFGPAGNWPGLAPFIAGRLGASVSTGTIRA